MGCCSERDYFQQKDSFQHFQTIQNHKVILSHQPNETINIIPTAPPTVTYEQQKHHITINKQPIQTQFEEDMLRGTLTSNNVTFTYDQMMRNREERESSLVQSQGDFRYIPPQAQEIQQRQTLKMPTRIQVRPLSIITEQNSSLYDTANHRPSSIANSGFGNNSQIIISIPKIQ